MWWDVIVLLSPTRDQDSGFFKGEKDFPIQQSIAHVAVERLDITILPRTAQFDEQGFHA